MSNIGNLSFSVHLQDMTDADIAKIKQKLQNLSLSLNIDGNNIKVSNADVIKKQIENAVMHPSRIHLENLHILQSTILL